NTPAQFGGRKFVAAFTRRHRSPGLACNGVRPAEIARRKPGKRPVSGGGEQSPDPNECSRNSSDEGRPGNDFADGAKPGRECRKIQSTWRQDLVFSRII